MMSEPPNKTHHLIAVALVVGDRAELLEHGTFLGVVFITAAFLTVTQFKPAQHLSTRQNKGLRLAFTS